MSESVCEQQKRRALAIEAGLEALDRARDPGPKAKFVAASEEAADETSRFVIVCLLYVL